MRLSKTLSPLVATALLIPMGMTALPAAHAVDAADDVTIIEVVEDAEVNPEEDLAVVEDKIDTLKDIQDVMPNTDYTEQVQDLLAVALDMEVILKMVANGGIPTYDLQTIPARIALLVEVTETINTAVHTLHHKVDPAHIELGLETTKAILMILSPGGSTAKLTAEVSELQVVLDRVSTYPDLKPTDRASLSMKAYLDRGIWQVRVKRDKNVLGKKDYATYRTLNKAITKAVGVWGDASKTVAEVDAARAELFKAYATAVGAPDKDGNKGDKDGGKDGKGGVNDGGRKDGGKDGKGGVNDGGRKDGGKDGKGGVNDGGRKDGGKDGKGGVNDGGRKDGGKDGKGGVNDGGRKDGGKDGKGGDREKSKS